MGGFVIELDHLVCVSVCIYTLSRVGRRFQIILHLAMKLNEPGKLWKLNLFTERSGATIANQPLLLETALSAAVAAAAGNCLHIFHSF